MRKVLAPFAILAAVAATPAASAAEWWRGTLGVQSENDLFAFRGRDRHYTNGTRLSWVSEPVERDRGLWGWAPAIADAVPWFARAGDTRVGVAFGQNFYTPADVDRRDLIVDDRPYAGWTYVGFALVRVGTETVAGKAEPMTLDTIELNLGIVGPGAGGRKVQNRWHNFIGVDRANGWSNQIDNEPGATLFVERKWRAERLFDNAWDREFGFDATPHVAASLGNLQTYAAAGLTLRMGDGLDRDFGPPRIRPSLSGSGYFVPPTSGFGWYVFAGFEGRAVARDIFIDGNTDGGGHSADRQPLVVDVQAGLALLFGWARFSYTLVYRSEEFRGQNGGDLFGALTFSLNF